MFDPRIRISKKSMRTAAIHNCIINGQSMDFFSSLRLAAFMAERHPHDQNGLDLPQRLGPP
jgi:hypothetical protein